MIDLRTEPILNRIRCAVPPVRGRAGPHSASCRLVTGEYPAGPAARPWSPRAGGGPPTHESGVRIPPPARTGPGTGQSGNRRVRSAWRGSSRPGRDAPPGSGSGTDISAPASRRWTATFREPGRGKTRVIASGRRHLSPWGGGPAGGCRIASSASPNRTGFLEGFGAPWSLTSVEPPAPAHRTGGLAWGAVLSGARLLRHAWSLMSWSVQTCRTVHTTAPALSTNKPANRPTVLRSNCRFPIRRL